MAAPSTAPYWAIVTIQGHAGPDASVVVYTRRSDQSEPTKSPVLHADADGAFSWPFRLARYTRFWAASDGRVSAVRATGVVQASCTVSGPAFSTLPFDLLPEPTDTQTTFAAFTANRGHVWAGYAYDGAGAFAVVRWTYGAPPRVLDRFVYRDGPPAEPNYHGAVNIAGVTPNGLVVAAVQSPTTDGHYLGLYWTPSGRHQLHGRSTWSASWPLQVLDNGSILGVALRSADHAYLLVSWATPTAPARELMVFGTGNYPTPQADLAGDVAFDRGSRNEPAHIAVRLRSGQVRWLATPDGRLADGYASAAGRYSMYAEHLGVAKWDLLHVPESGPIPPVVVTGSDGRNAFPTAAGRHGEIVVGMNYGQHLRTAAGAWVAMPPEPDTFDYPGQAFDDSGRLAFTARSDGLPHFLTCH